MFVLSSVLSIEEYFCYVHHVIKIYISTRSPLNATSIKTKSASIGKKQFVLVCHFKVFSCTNIQLHATTHSRSQKARGYINEQLLTRTGLEIFM